MEKKKIEFSLNKEKALKIAKKAASSKFAIMKDSGFVFKVGAPMMVATVEVEDNAIYVSGASTVANTVYNDICGAIEEEQNAGAQSGKQEAAPTNSGQGSFADNQLKVALAIKVFSELKNEGILTEEEFHKKKVLLLKFAMDCESEYEKTPVLSDSLNVQMNEEISEKTQVDLEAEKEIIEVNDEATKEDENVAEVVKDEKYYDEISEKGKKYFNEDHNFEKAYECFLEASSHNQKAKYNLANICYLNGYGTNKNREEAIRLLKELEAEGYEKASELLKKI